MLGRRVWADDDVQALAKNFLCVADEVWTLDHVDTPGAKFFKDYVASAGGSIAWGATTKQGVYVMTPDGEYLGGHFARHDKASTLTLLKDSLQKWNDLVAKKGLKPKPIPARRAARTWGQEGLAVNAGGDAGRKSALILEVFVRDLPYKGERHPGPDQYRNWVNQTWMDFTTEELQGLIPKGGVKTPVPDPLARKFAREGLFDFVRGQSGGWADAGIRKLTMTAEPAGTKDGAAVVRYQGEFELGDASRGFDGKIYGTAQIDRSGRFKMVELVAAGMRRGKTENFRGDAPPSPLGIAFVIEGQYEKAGAPPGQGLGLSTKSEDKKAEEKDK
ncbi:MAG TPA: hypothetical protein VNM14_15575 [Planctomycetota bacterium]|nr:hypothetical protein [Planctomycetota bacterium]